MTDRIMHSVCRRLMPQNTSHIISRSATLILGLATLAFGVVLSIRSQLGTSPVSSVPYALSYIVPLSVGTLTIILHSFMILLQYLSLRKQFHWTRCLQLLVGMTMGIFIDLMLMWTSAWHMDHYLGQLFMCLMSCIFTAVGICLIIKADLINLAIEGFYQVISLKYGISFSRCKTIGDILMVLFAMLSALVFTQQVIGVREGTVITALMVGIMIKWIMPYLHFLDHEAKPSLANKQHA